MKHVARGAIHFYQSWSATRPPSCRFTPSCSHYTDEAIEDFGVARGSWMGLMRICRCHPWGGHGIDPVPVGKAN